MSDQPMSSTMIRMILGRLSSASTSVPTQTRAAIEIVVKAFMVTGSICNHESPSPHNRSFLQRTPNLRRKSAIFIRDGVEQDANQGTAPAPITDAHEQDRRLQESRTHPPQPSLGNGLKQEAFKKRGKNVAKSGTDASSPLLKCACYNEERPANVFVRESN